MKTLKQIIAGTLVAGALAIGNLGCELNPQPEELQQIPDASSQGKIFFVEDNEEEVGNQDRIYNSSVDLWSANADGSNLKQLWDGLDYQERIKISPDGNYLTFAKSDRNMGHVIMDLEGRVIKEFTGSNRSGADFRWTPDSKTILFSGYASGQGIYRYDLDGDVVTHLFVTRGYKYDHSPTISPNLDKIVFTHHEYGSQYWIYLMGPFGENPQLLTRGEGSQADEDFNYFWLDNDNLLFKIGSKRNLYFANTLTKEVREVPTGIDVTFNEMSISPDRTRIALYGYGQVHFADFQELLSGKMNFSTEYFSSLSGCSSWSKDSDYFILGSASFHENDAFKIFDRNLKEYKFIDDKDFPEKLGNIGSLEWVN